MTGCPETRAAGIFTPRLRIGDVWLLGSGETYPVDLPIPGDGRVWVDSASGDDVARAAQAAAQAAGRWAKQSADERADLLRRLARSIRAESAELISLQTTEAATPVAQAGVSITHSADYLDGLGALTRALDDEWLSDRAVLQHIPLGPVAVVTSWNQGFANIVQAAGTALLAGCTVILKPSERAPFTATRFVQLALDAGFPDGVVNLLLGGPDIARTLARQEEVAGLHLTGGAKAATTLRSIAAGRGIAANMELGGKSGLVVRADADLVAAATHAVSAAIVLSGQACTSPTRIFVEATVRAKFERLLRGFLRRVTLGDPRDPRTTMGPMISQDSRARILETVQDALDAGAGLLDPSMAHDSSGPWLRPIVLTDPPPDCEAAREELFGPVLCLWSFTTDAEAATAVNQTPFGLSAYVYGTDMPATLTLARALTAGTVWIGGAPPLPPNIPFGGIGKSGDGRLGGVVGIRRFTWTRTIWSGS